MNEMPSTMHVEAGKINEGDFMMIMDKPCRVDTILKVDSEVPGKNKVHVIGIDLFGGNDVEMIFRSDDIIDEPLAKTTKYEFVEFDGNKTLKLKNEKGKIKNIELKAQGVMKDVKDKIQKMELEGIHPLVSVAKIGDYLIPYDVTHK